MDRLEPVFDDIVAAFRRKLVDVAEAMRNARSPEEFCRTERSLAALADATASEVTRQIVQQHCDDKERRREALDLVRARAAERGIEMRTERDRQTEFRTLSGITVQVTASYASARPRGGPARDRRGPQGTGVYPVLDQLGVVGRSTPALKLLVARVVCEANSVTSGRELLSASGVAIDHKAALRLTYDVTEIALRAGGWWPQSMEEGSTSDAASLGVRRRAAASTSRRSGESRRW